MVSVLVELKWILTRYVVLPIFFTNARRSLALSAAVFSLLIGPPCIMQMHHTFLSFRIKSIMYTDAVDWLALLSLDDFLRGYNHSLLLNC